MCKITNFRQRLLWTVMVMFLAMIPVKAFAQQTILVQGTVTDDTNEPLMGATVIVPATGVATATDIDGHYSINVAADGVIVFSYIGMKPVEEKVDGRTTIDVMMATDVQMMDEVVVVGYGVQRRGSVTGAVSAIKGSEMIQTKNENPQNMLTGRIPGVRVWQKSSEPGTFNNNFDIRGLGAPLIVIDGIPRTTEEFQRLNANDIEDISVLKDASAAIYGVRAANGVLLVTTKSGGEGAPKVTYSGSYTLQKPSSMPTLADAFDAMTIYNESKMNNVNGGSIVFTEADFETYRTGKRRITDWNSLVFKDIAPQTQHDLSISGGTDRVSYYASFGYFFQDGIFKSGDLNYEKFNVRSNLGVKIIRGLKLDMNLSGVIDQRNTPYNSSVDIIRNYWKQGVLNPAYADPANTMLNYDGLDLEQNTIAMMTSDISGYKKYKQKYFESSATLNFDFGEYVPALKGLTARAMVSYDYRMDNNEAYRKEYYQYRYNSLTDSYDQKIYNSSSPSTMRREFYDKSQTLTQFVLNYSRKFNGKHDVGALIGWETQKRNGDNFYAFRDLAFSKPYLMVGVTEGQVGGMNSGNNDIYEYANEALIGRVNYSFADRYLFEAQFRYDGSSKFAKGHRWGFFPSVSAGWRVSEEPFFRSIDWLDFVGQLKFRASYGVLGDDGSLEYDWAMGYSYPATSGNMTNGDYNGYSPGWVFNGAFINAATPLALPNETISWYKSKTFNIGFDFETRDGIFGASFDYFNRHRSGLFARRSSDITTVVGATAPRENLNSDRHFGLELQLTHRNTIGNVRYNLKGIVTVTRNKYLTYIENEGKWGNSYERWRNDNMSHRYQGVQFGYTSAGRYNSWNEIWYDRLYHEKDVLPGDYRYEDWNGDGEINGQDEHPFAFDQTPWMNYSLNIGVQWKDFDFSALLQGSALGSMEYKEPLYSIWGDMGGGILQQYTDRWHPVDPTADPYDPATKWVSGYYAYTGHYPKSNSEFNRVSTDYLRLKSIELGYTLPRKLTGTTSIRFYVNAYNVLTFTGVKFVDPEHPDDELGRMYPLNKTYTVGLNVSF